ncbi:MAG: type I DNA topoisomerase [Dehalococcoidia bacterium]
MPRKGDQHDGARNLVIVESPAKARTISRILGSDYTVKASLGHVRDLPPNTLGVDIQRNFTPTYLVLGDKRSVIRELKRLSQESPTIYLATDPDREGEAISWHLVKAAGWDRAPVRRVVFHEITEPAVQEAFRSPRGIDMRLVEAQQARRILDRLVGYQLSPLLWSKVQKGLSAGRVQSVALRLTVVREQEIEAFTPKEYWTIQSQLLPHRRGDRATPFLATLSSLKGKKGKLTIGSEAAASQVLEELRGASYTVAEVKQRETRQSPAPPFTTSTLQQEAWRKLRFSPKKTMLVAQQLYEGMRLGSEGEVGLITYMRTDSTQVASSAVQEARQFIEQRFGRHYLPPAPRVFDRRAKGAQEAHEAIRPTSLARVPEAVRSQLPRDHHRLYALIWKRMLSSQMAEVVVEVTGVDIEARCTAPSASLRTSAPKSYLFRATGQVLKFPGFRILYLEGRDEEGEEEDGEGLPELSTGEALECLDTQAKQNFTEPPPRYTEASLIKTLEERGIGRPSTYAPTLSTLLDRSYVTREKGRLKPTALGQVVSDLLSTHFPDIMDYNFTAQMEESLDLIARGERQWVPVLRAFYRPFEQAVATAKEAMPRVKVTEPTDEVCEKCGKPMVIRAGKYGRFLACTGFPQCRNSRSLVNRTGIPCPQCGSGELIERRSKKRGLSFYGCSRYPDCTFMVRQRPLAEPCPECGGLLVVAGRQQSRCTSCAYRGTVPEEEGVPVEV